MNNNGKTNLGAPFVLSADVCSEDDFLEFARTLADQGHLYNAIHECEEILAVNPLSSEAYLELSKHQLSLYLYEHSLTSIKRALSIDPSFAPAFIRRGFIYLQQAEYHSARSAFFDALSLNPRCTISRIGISLTLIKEDRHVEAIQELSAAYSLSPQDATIALVYSSLLDIKGQSSQALMIAKRLVCDNPKFIAGHEHLAHLLLKIGYIYKARSMFNQLLSMQPMSFSARLGCCKAAFECGDYSDFHRHLDLLLKHA